MSAALEIVGENVPVNVAVDISKAVDKAYSSILLSALSVLSSPFTTNIFDPSALKPSPWWKLLLVALPSVLVKVLVSGLYGVERLYSSTRFSALPSKTNIFVPLLLKANPLGSPPIEVWVVSVAVIDPIS